MKNVSFLPPDYENQLREAARRRRMAEMLSQQATEPIEQPQQAGAKTSWTQVLAKGLQAYLGNRESEKASKAEAEVADKTKTLYDTEMADYNKARMGTPAQAPMIAGDDEGNAMPMVPAQKADTRELLVKALMASNPKVQQIGQMDYSNAQGQAAAEAAARAKAQEGYNLAPGAKRFQGNQMIAENVAPEKVNYNQPFLPDGTPNLAYQKFAMERGKAGAPNVAVNMGKGDNKYIEERLQGRAKSMAELDKSAEASYKTVKAIDRFMEASEKGTEGGAQPVITLAQNFLSSFGYAPGVLKDVRQMEQAVGDILGTKMAELGARGLTDKDMEVLRESLPRINTDRAARQNVAAIVRKAAENNINEWKLQRQEEAKTYPDLGKRIPEPNWARQYESERKAKAPAGVDKKVWDAMTPEERALFQ